MRGKEYLFIFAITFFVFFVFNVGAQSETFIAAEKLYEAECSSSEGYSLAGQFVDGEGNNINLCVKRQEFVAGNSYVRDSYFEIASGNECVNADNNLIKVGSFNDFNEKGIFLCRRAHVIDDGTQFLLISDVTVREDECPSDYVQSGPVIDVAGGKKIRHCVQFKDSSRKNELDGCGGYTFDAGNECVYDVTPGGEGADVGEELEGVLRQTSDTDSCGRATCVCRGANIYPQSAGWACTVSEGSGGGGSGGSSGGGSGGGSVGECEDSDNSPSNVEGLSDDESLFTKGNVTFGENKKLSDGCDGERVVEAYCAEGEGKIESVACPEGNVCYAGRCVDPLSEEFEETCILINSIWADTSLNEIGTAIGEGGVSSKELENAEGVQSSDVIFLLVYANSYKCVGKNVEFRIYEKDRWVDDFIKTKPAKMTSDGFAIFATKLTWSSDINAREIASDIPLIGNLFPETEINPQFYFKAKIVGEKSEVTSDLLELFKPQIEGPDYSSSEVLWESYTEKGTVCPKDTFLVGFGVNGNYHCAELNRVSDGMKVIWNGNARQISLSEYCSTNEASIGANFGTKKRNCVKLKLTDSKDKVILNGAREVSANNDCRKSEIIIKTENRKNYCVLVSIEESASSSGSSSGSGGGSSKSGGLFGGEGFGDIIGTVIQFVPKLLGS